MSEEFCNIIAPAQNSVLQPEAATRSLMGCPFGLNSLVATKLRHVSRNQAMTMSGRLRTPSPALAKFAECQAVVIGRYAAQRLLVLLLETAWDLEAVG